MLQFTNKKEIKTCPTTLAIKNHYEDEIQTLMGKYQTSLNKESQLMEQYNYLLKAFE